MSIKVIHDTQTNEVYEVEMTKAEIAQQQIDKIEVLAEQKAEAAKVAEKAALLAKLGITEDEAKLLLS